MGNSGMYILYDINNHVTVQSLHVNRGGQTIKILTSSTFQEHAPCN